MTFNPPESYAPELALVESTMADEIGHWDWRGLEFAEQTIRMQLRRRGIQLRPMLALAFTELLGGEPGRACVPAASVELCHLAALMLDDVQDALAAGQGVAADDAAAAPASTAVSVAAIIQSLSYHPIRRSPQLSQEEKAALRQELDRTVTQSLMGQAMDAGWREDWYYSYADFPYERMIQRKTGALFGCAAAMGARVAGADQEEIRSARRFGVSLGSLHQMIDDYLDLFGSGELGRAVFGEFQAGKMTGPVIRLLTALDATGHDDDARQVLRLLAGQPVTGGADWLLALMREHAVGESMRRDLTARADALHAEAASFGTPPGGPAVRQVVALVAAPVYDRS